MKIKSLIITTLCVTGLSSLTWAEPSNPHFHDLTQKPAPASRPQILAKKSPTIRHHALIYSPQYYTSIDNLELEGQIVHRLEYYNRRSGLYGFASIGQGSTIKDNKVLVLFSSSDFDFDTEFRIFQFGIGGRLESKKEQNGFAGFGEIGFQIYDGLNSSLSLSGIFAAAGLEYVHYLSPHFQLVPSLGIRYESLDKASVKGTSGKLSDTESGIAFQAGAKLRYLF